MPCTSAHPLRPLAALMLALLANLASPIAAKTQQSSTTSSALPAGIAPYRLPSIAMVQPFTATSTGVVPGGSVPQDHPVVVFRFAQGEPTDPLDLTSFAVTIIGPEIVNGENRTMLFQLTAAEAWGPIGDSRSSKALVAGTFQVTGRICSSRGACGSTTGMVTVLASPPAMTTEAEAKPGIKDRVLGLLRGLGRLVVP